jgi:hypothetical protein
MKTFWFIQKYLFRIEICKVALAALVLFAASSNPAQSNCADLDGQTSLYTIFTNNRLVPSNRKIAVAAAKRYVQKYGNCDEVGQQLDYLKAYLERYGGPDRSEMESRSLDVNRYHGIK